MEEWVQYRACTVEVLPLFFSLDLGDERKAKNICVGCPVKEPCLEFALKHDEKGVWGGTSDRERNRIRIRRYQEHSDSAKLSSSLQHNNIHELVHPNDAFPLPFLIFLSKKAVTYWLHRSWLHYHSISLPNLGGKCLDRTNDLWCNH